MRLNKIYPKVSYLIVVLFVLALNDTFAQKFGYVDTDFVLNKMPEYNQAKDEINKISLVWEEEIQNMYKEIQEKEAALQAEEILLTKEMKDDRLVEITAKWDEVKE